MASFPLALLAGLALSFQAGSDCERARKLVLTPQDSAAAGERELALEELRALVPGCRGELFAALATGRFEAEGAPLPATGREWLLETLASPAPTELFAFLDATVDRTQAGPDRLAALELIARHGNAGAVRLAIAMAQLDPGIACRSQRPFRDGLESTLATLLARDGDAFRALEHEMPRLPEALLVPVLRALARSGSPRALEPMRTALHENESAAGIVLAELGRMAIGLDADTRVELVADLSDFVQHPHPGVRAAVARALDACACRAGVPLLIQLLGDAETSVRTSAHRALLHLTGVRFRPDAARWQAWWEREQRWLTDECPTELENLRSEDLATVHAALRRIEVHPLFQPEVTPDLIELLDAQNVDVRAQVCALLARLGAVEALPRLAEVLRYDEAPAWRAAWDALKRLTQADLPPEPDAWDAFLAKRDSRRS